MTDLVDPSEAERIVGINRHATDHYARADSTTQVVTILHSAECRDSGIDLRECRFSVALERGITAALPWAGWRRLQDLPVEVEVFRGYLVPNLPTVKAAHRAALADGAGS